MKKYLSDYLAMPGGSKFNITVKLHKKSIFIPLIFCVFTVIIASSCSKATAEVQAPPAIYSDEMSSEAPDPAITDQVFPNEKLVFEQRVEMAYEQLFASLPEESQTLLMNAQLLWQDYYEKYEQALCNQLNKPAEVSGGIEGEKRKTNIYEDNVVSILKQRATDMEGWVQGRYGYGDQTAEAILDAQKELNAQKCILNDAFEENIRIMPEAYRIPMRDVQASWNAFVSANTDFIAALTQNNEAVKNAEEIIQVREMSDLMKLHFEGTILFRGDKED